MRIYLVGGAVRDQLLDLPIKDKDWVVTDSSNAEMLEKGYQYINEKTKFPVFLDPKTHQEYALARKEIKKGTGYQGFEVETANISIETDLKRRDLTINAIAQDSTGKLIDPYNGQADLNDGLLRHVSPAFVEDPVRLLRIARFSAKLGCWGFRIAHGTHSLMKKMAKQPDIHTLNPQRTWQEMKQSFNQPQPWLFFHVLQQCGALAVILPHLSKSLGEIQGHSRSQSSKPIAALKIACKNKINPQNYYALIFYFSQNKDQFMAGKKETQQLAQLLKFTPLIETLDLNEPSNIYDFLVKFAAFKTDQQFNDLIQLATIIFNLENKPTAQQKLLKLQAIAERCLNVNAKKLQQQGFKGKALGDKIKKQRLQLIDNLDNI